MSEAELEAEAVRLLDTHGEWLGGREWWVRVGLPDPPRELMEAVKGEMIRRKWAAHPPLPGAAFFHFRSREPDVPDDGASAGAV
jgi:hypothetical protein